MNSIVTDLITRIKNGYLSHKNTVRGLYSRSSEDIVKILKSEQFIKDYKYEEDGSKKSLLIELLYINTMPAFSDVRILSKPGRRMYQGVSQLKPVAGGIGIAIISTPKGIMTTKQAKKDNMGGEILFELW